MADTLPNEVLRNKLNLTDPSSLKSAEADLTFARLRRLESEGPTGPFSLERLKAIHHYIFQDVYQWAGEVRAGEVRTVELYKGGYKFTAVRDRGHGARCLRKAKKNSVRNYNAYILKA